MVRSKILVAGLVLMMAITSLWVVAPAAAAGGQPNPIVVRAQDTNAGVVIADSVNAPAAGWLFIRRDANGMPGGIIGFAPVYQGMNTGVSVDIKTARSGHDDGNLVTPVLWATFSADPSAVSPFAAPDTSAFEQAPGGSAVAFSSTAAGGAAQ